MKFGIIGNKSKPTIGGVLDKLIGFLNLKKIDYIIEESLANRIKVKPIKDKCFSLNHLLNNSDIIISIGGDGTFLNTARKVGNRVLPILGVNLGNLGFMAEVMPNEMNKFILEILKGNYKVYDLCVISSKIDHRKETFGMNELVIDKCNSIKMVEIEIFYKNERVVNFVGDGVIISTPTGSTGYSLSAGGPIISPYSKVFIITPICPHTLNFRPIIVPDDGSIKIKTLGKEKVRLTADGFKSIIYNSPAEFNLTKAEHTVKVVKKINKTYFQTLNNKLLWGADVRHK